MPKLLLLVTAMVELGTGLALLVAPSLVVELLLGEGLSSPQSLAMGRIMGSALISISVACWLASKGEPSDRRGIAGSMVIYNVAVPAALICTAINFGISGIALWPACVLHFGLAIWCIFCVRNR